MPYLTETEYSKMMEHYDKLEARLDEAAKYVKQLEQGIEAAERVIDAAVQLLAKTSYPVTPHRKDEVCLYCGAGYTEQHESWCGYIQSESEYEKLYEEYKKGQASC